MKDHHLPTDAINHKVMAKTNKSRDVMMASCPVTIISLEHSPAPSGRRALMLAAVNAPRHSVKFHD